MAHLSFKSTIMHQIRDLRKKFKPIMTNQQKIMIIIIAFKVTLPQLNIALSSMHKHEYQRKEGKDIT
jgi:hypothetical protein